MRLVAPLGLVAALALSTGCFVFDEIDKGQKIMDKHSGRGAKHAAADAEPAAEEAEEEAPGLIARIQGFWEEARAEEEPERSADDSIITCEFSGGGTTFTYESDCLSRGGEIR